MYGTNVIREAGLISRLSEMGKEIDKLYLCSSLN